MTIIEDRYGGAYSGGKWIACPGDVFWSTTNFLEKFREIWSDDVSCSMWWDEHKDDVGVGQTPEEARQDLLRKHPDAG